MKINFLDLRIREQAPTWKCHYCDYYQHGGCNWEAVNDEIERYGGVAPMRRCDD